MEQTWKKCIKWQIFFKEKEVLAIVEKNQLTLSSCSSYHAECELAHQSHDSLLHTEKCVPVDKCVLTALLVHPASTLLQPNQAPWPSELLQHLLLFQSLCPL